MTILESEDGSQGDSSTTKADSVTAGTVVEWWSRGSWGGNDGPGGGAWWWWWNASAGSSAGWDRDDAGGSWADGGGEGGDGDWRLGSRRLLDRWLFGSGLFSLAVVLDAELSRVLVLAGSLDDDLDAVVGDVVFEVGVGHPDVGAGVVDGVDDGADGDDVGAWATEEEDGDLSFGGGIPGDLELLADGHLLVELGSEDGVTGWWLGGVWGGSSRHGGHEGSEEGEGREFHYELSQDVVVFKLKERRKSGRW